MKRLLAVAVLLVCGTFGCAESVVIGSGTGGAALAGGAAYYFLNLNVTAQICYWIGDEGALLVMPHASTAVDKDVLMACQDALDYLDNAKGLPAEVVNQVITAKFANLPPDIKAALVAAAVVLGQYVPSANVILSSGEIEDIRQFIKGWRDGTQTALNNAADVPAKLAKATAKKIKLQMKRPGKFAVAQSGGGWFNK